MKGRFLLFFLLIPLLSAFCEEETLISGDIHHGGFGGPVFKITSINGQVGVINGGRGAWLINHRFLIGGGGYNLSSDVDMDSWTEGIEYDVLIPARLKFNYGGIELGYIHHPTKILHYAFNITLGYGNVNWVDQDDDTEELEQDKVFVIEPSVNIEFNITSWFRIMTGLGYRYVNDVDVYAISDADLSALVGMLTLKFGSF